MRKIQLLLSKINRLIKLIEEHENIFFEERKYLEDLSFEPKIEFKNERRQEIELKIKKTMESISTELVKKIPVKTSKTEQEKFL